MNEPATRRRTYLLITIHDAHSFNNRLSRNTNQCGVSVSTHASETHANTRWKGQQDGEIYWGQTVTLELVAGIDWLYLKLHTRYPVETNLEKVVAAGAIPLERVLGSSVVCWNIPLMSNKVQVCALRTTIRTHIVEEGSEGRQPYVPPQSCNLLSELAEGVRHLTTPVSELVTSATVEFFMIPVTIFNQILTLRNLVVRRHIQHATDEQQVEGDLANG